MNVLLLKETRADESRVALVVKDVEILIRQYRCVVFVESDAGVAAGCSNVDYEAVGAKIVATPTTADECKSLFANADVVVRCKRPSLARQALERGAYRNGMHLVAVVDVLAQDAAEMMRELSEIGVCVHSIDQLSGLSRDDPMNLLAAMSRIAGRLAMQDALQEFGRKPTRIVIVGFGVCGESALQEARNSFSLSDDHVEITVMCSHQPPSSTDRAAFRVVLLDKSKPIDEQQRIVLREIETADIVLTCARNNNQRAPVLISLTSLEKMHSGSIVIDLALTEGGNVESSKHDETVIVGSNGVKVKNVSGYPKRFPSSASVAWSLATRLYLQKFILKND